MVSFEICYKIIHESKKKLVIQKSDNNQYPSVVLGRGVT